MYDEWAEVATYYDELYVKPEQYQVEATKAAGLVETYKLSDGNDLLDLACGTGGHIPYWHQHYYHVTGLDLSPQMLAHAVRKFPDIEFHLGDMVNFTLDRHFDAILGASFVHYVQSDGRFGQSNACSSLVKSRRHGSASWQ